MSIAPEQLRSESQSDLKKRLKNCESNPKYAEYIPILKQALDSRFPGWNKTSQGRGSKTIATFKGKREEFDTAKDAYIWLVKNFEKTNPTLFTDDLGRKARKIFAGQIDAKNKVKRMYFAKSKEKLFIESPHLADDPRYSFKLPNGWHINLDLNTGEMFERLCRLARSCNLKHPDDWEFMTLNPTEQFLDARLINEML
jgi:hypothetical protein